MRTINFIASTLFIAGAICRLFAGEYLETAMGVFIAIQLWIIEFYAARCKGYRKCLESISAQLDKLKESIMANNEQD